MNNSKSSEHYKVKLGVIHTLPDTSITAHNPCLDIYNYQVDSRNSPQFCLITSPPPKTHITNSNGDNFADSCTAFQNTRSRLIPQQNSKFPTLCALGSVTQIKASQFPTDITLILNSSAYTMGRRMFKQKMIVVYLRN